MLEAAYKRDPKPDKNARLDIVNQVSMGEKEVQVSIRCRRRVVQSVRANNTKTDLVPEPKAELATEVQAVATT